MTTGRVRGKRRARGPLRYLPGGWSDETLPVHAYAVVHPDGVCLFDTGQTALATNPGYHTRWHPFLWLARFELAPEDEAAAQIDAHSVRWVVLSHLHTDHIGGLVDFRHADVLVSRTEWDRAQGFGGQLRGYLPQHWPQGLRPQLIDFAGPPLGPFAASFDLLGDGSLVLLPTPGHTPGHLGLLANRRVLLGGDMAHAAEELRLTAPEISAWCRHEGVRVLLAHDPEAGA